MSGVLGRGEVKTILHLCADIGSDSYPYQLDPNYEVIKIGKEIGVENYNPDREIHGIIANPVCTEFSTAKGFHKKIEEGPESVIKPSDLGILHDIKQRCECLDGNPIWVEDASIDY